MNLGKTKCSIDHEVLTALANVVMLAPRVFDNFFQLLNIKHIHNTRLLTKLSFSLPMIRTNYGMFSIRYCGPKIWNSIDELDKYLPKNLLKVNLKSF